MRKIIINGLCAVMGVALLLVVSATTACEKVGEEGSPAPAGRITGPDKVAEGYSVTLSIDAIEGASTYKWSCDGLTVQHSESRTLEISVAGTYRVVGVNHLGEGVASAPKTITMSDEISLIDRMVGQWDVSEWGVTNTTSIYDNDHVITITKYDDHTIEISNFTFTNYDPYEAVRGDEVLATVDSERGTMTILPNWVFTPTWVDDYATVLSPIVSKYAEQNFGAPFPVQTIFEDVDGKLKMVMKTGTETQRINLGAEGIVTVPATYMITTTQRGIYTGFLNFYLNTTWKKQ